LVRCRRLRVAAGGRHQQDLMTGGINCVSWNSSTVDRRELRNNESAAMSAQPGLEFAQAL
jgi:hypothetical protein